MGADVNLRTDNGTVALEYAAENGHIKVAEALLKAGADINQRTTKAGRACDGKKFPKGITAVRIAEIAGQGVRFLSQLLGFALAIHSRLRGKSSVLY